MKTLFFETASKYSEDSHLIKKLWDEIEQSYSTPHRYYHTLEHIKEIISYLYPVKEQISDWDTIVFSTFYHDITYDIKSRDNEENSSLIAEERLQALSYDSEKIDKCIAQIIGTKDHKKSEDSDTNFFIDADLSILGASWEKYINYSHQIRKEYFIYPDSVYKKGRKEVLERILGMKCIYKTDYFHKNLEEKARTNIAKEIEIISL